MRFFKITGFFIAIFILGTKDAHAYLDPGSGSYLLQLLIAGAVGGLFTVKTFWLQIKTFFSNLFSRKQKKDSADKKKNGK